MCDLCRHYHEAVRELLTKLIKIIGDRLRDTAHPKAFYNNTVVILKDTAQNSRLDSRDHLDQIHIFIQFLIKLYLLFIRNRWNVAHDIAILDHGEARKINAGKCIVAFRPDFLRSRSRNDFSIKNNLHALRFIIGCIQKTVEQI